MNQPLNLEFLVASIGDGKKAARESFSADELLEVQEAIKAATHHSMRDQMNRGSADSLNDGVLGTLIVNNVLEAKSVQVKQPKQVM